MIMVAEPSNGEPDSSTGSQTAPGRQVVAGVGWAEADVVRVSVFCKRLPHITLVNHVWATVSAAIRYTSSSLMRKLVMLPRMGTEPPPDDRVLGWGGAIHMYVSHLQ